MSDLLKIDSVSKYYGSDVGVENISTTLGKGEVLGFLGPNGAGKTTTIRLILDFIRPSKGNIEIFGFNTAKDSLSIKQRLGYLSGDIALYPDMSGMQLMKYMTSLGRKTDWEYVTQMAESLEAQLDRPIRELSKGNRQKIGIIQAFMHKPDLVVLDEPTSGLDPLMQREFYNIVDETRQDGRSVFLSSHNLHEVQRLCDRAAFIRKGRLVAVEDINKIESLNLRRYQVRFKDKSPLDRLRQAEGVSEAEPDSLYKDRINLAVTGSPQALLSALSDYELLDFTELETSLEDVFMHYYDEGLG